MIPFQQDILNFEAQHGLRAIGLRRHFNRTMLSGGSGKRKRRSSHPKRRKGEAASDFIKRVNEWTKNKMQRLAKEEEKTVEVATCLICTETLTEGVVTLPCNHAFHRSCICQWMSTIKEDYSNSRNVMIKYVNSCPACRNELEDADKRYEICPGLRKTDSIMSYECYRCEEIKEFSSDDAARQAGWTVGNNEWMCDDCNLELHEEDIIQSIDEDDPELLRRILDATGIKPDEELQSDVYQGKIPMHMAVRENSPTVMDLFIARGANVNVKDREGDTPLLTLFKSYDRSERPSVDMAQKLIDAGADINVEDEQGFRALNYAVDNGRNLEDELVQVLYSNGALATYTCDYCSKTEGFQLHDSGFRQPYGSNGPSYFSGWYCPRCYKLLELSESDSSSDLSQKD